MTSKTRGALTALAFCENSCYSRCFLSVIVVVATCCCCNLLLFNMLLQGVKTENSAPSPPSHSQKIAKNKTLIAASFLPSHPTNKTETKNKNKNKSRTDLFTHLWNY